LMFRRTLWLTRRLSIPPPLIRYHNYRVTVVVTQPSVGGGRGIETLAASVAAGWFSLLEAGLS
jgi:hypothetical protein